MLILNRVFINKQFNLSQFYYKIFLNNIKCQLFLSNRFQSNKADQKEITEIHYPINNIRNFSIIAHVDHGKSTLADRLLEITGAIEVNSGKQVLDKLQVERERGITVKAQSVSLDYKFQDEYYLLNLIDTPGHVDFSNEVSRSLIASQGVILLIDANQGVQAQTVANFYMAFGKDLAIIPVLNKVDLPNADPKIVKEQLQTLFDIDPETVLQISAKFGTGIPDVLKAIVERIPAPSGDPKKPFEALIFDSWFDRYRGAIALVTVKQGTISVGDELQSAFSKQTFHVKSLGLLRPHEQAVTSLSTGQVGWVVCGLRQPCDIRVGDTWYLRSQPLENVSQPIKINRAAVFAGLYPSDQSQHVVLRAAIEKLVLNDPAVELAVDTSAALGQGWRLGFLGLLHLEVFSQRLEQEYGALTVLTAPSVTYKLKISGAKLIKYYQGQEEIYISNPLKFPDPQNIVEAAEPMILATIITPIEYLGAVLGLCHDYRGIQLSSTNIDQNRIMLQFEMPLNEIMIDFHDKLKSISSGYASFDYEDNGYKTTVLNKISVFLNGKEVEELTIIAQSSRSRTVARQIVNKLKEMIPRQLIHIAIQAKIAGKVIAREDIKPFRKDVTAKLYGGDVTRRKKLLKQQSEGKKKMRLIANIEVPRDTFIKVLKR